MLAVSENDKRVLNATRAQIASFGLSVVQVRVELGSTSRVQIMVEDASGGINVDRCAHVSGALGPVMDGLDLFDGAYALEISSPGIDRPLTRRGDFASWTGHLAKVTTCTPIGKRRHFTGHIIGESDAVVRLRGADGDEVAIGHDQMRSAHLVMTDSLMAEARRRHDASRANAGSDKEMEAVRGQA